MKKIKFGLKLWSNSNLSEEEKEYLKNDLFQYIELTAVPDTEIAPFLEHDFSYIIHIPPETQGLNIADKEKKEFNLKTIDNCIEWAEKLNAKHLVLHPGFGSMDNTLEFLDKINDPRILIENMPKLGLDNEHMVGYAPEQIKELMGNKFGFCLDFGHAIKASVSLNRNYKEVLLEFMKLKPAMFHLSDGNTGNEKDEHLSLGKGNFDLSILLDFIAQSESEMVTLETPRNNLKDDEENIKYIEGLIKGH